MPASAFAIRSLQRALLDVCLGQIEDVAEAVQLWQRLDQVLADALTGRAVAVIEAAGESRPVADDAARRAVDEKPVSQFPAPAEAPTASHVKQPEPEPEPAPEPEPPVVITDEPRPPATPREPPPKARRLETKTVISDVRPWTVAEEQRCQRWRDEGKPWAWIGEQIGRTENATKVHFVHLTAKQRKEQEQRNCLNCGRSFASTGPGNRLCKNCDGRSEGLAA